MRRADDQFIIEQLCCGPVGVASSSHHSVEDRENWYARVLVFECHRTGVEAAVAVVRSPSAL